MQTQPAPCTMLALLRRGLLGCAAVLLLLTGCGGSSGTVDRQSPDGDGRDVPGERDARERDARDDGGDAGDATGDAGSDVPLDDVAPDADAPDAVTPDAVTPDALTPDAIEPSEVDVEGQVVNLAGQPVQTRVAIVPYGVAAPLERQDTDSEGRFSFPRTPRPYTLLVEGAPGLPSIIYQGLTRRDLTVLSYALPSFSMARLEGSLTGASPPSDGALAGTIVVAAGEGILESITEVSQTSYELQTWWLGDAPLAATVHALTRELAPPNVTLMGFLGYGQREVTLMPGEAASGVDVTLSPVDTATLSYDLVAPGTSSGFIGGVSLGVAVDLDLGTAAVFVSNSNQSADSLVVPAVPGARYRLTASEFRYGTQPTDVVSVSQLRRTHLELGTMPLEDTLPPSPEIISPADDAHVPLDAVLTWTVPEDGIHGVDDLTLPDLGPVIVFSDEPRLDLASLPTEGKPLRWPAGAPVRYRLLFNGAFTSLDEAAGAGERLLPVEARGYGRLARSFDYRFSWSYHELITAAE